MTEPFQIRRRDVPSQLNYLAQQLTTAHDQLADLDETYRPQRVTILAVAMALGGLADQTKPAGACPITLSATFGDEPETLRCRYPDGHTGMHASDPTVEAADARWITEATGAVDHSKPDTTTNHERQTCGEAYHTDPDNPCVLDLGHALGRFDDGKSDHVDGRGETW